MPWSVTHNESQKFVEVSYTGSTSAADIRESAVKAIALVGEHTATLGLVDCLEQTDSVSVDELSELPELYDDEGLSQTISIAFVEPAKTELKTLAMFYELVCVNRGWNLRRFATRDAAMDWLLSLTQE